MLFEEALAAARAGQKVRLVKWVPGTYFTLSESPECPQDPRKFFWLYQNYGVNVRLIPWGDLQAFLDDEFELYTESPALRLVLEKTLKTQGVDSLFGMSGAQEKLLASALEIIQEELPTQPPSLSSSIDPQLQQKILNTLSDSLADMLYYHRKEDEILSVGDIEEAISKRVISVNDLVSVFKASILNSVSQWEAKI